MVIQTSLSPNLAGLSILLAVGTSYTALELIGRMFTGEGRRTIYGLCGAVALGVGIWSSQITGLQALEGHGVGVPDLSEMVYDWRLTALALVAAVAFGGLAIAAFTRKNGTGPAALLGGVIMGLGTTVVHALCLNAMRMPVVVGYNPSVSVVAALAAAATSMMALGLAFAWHAAEGWSPRRVVAATVLGGAMAGLNLALIGAATFGLPARASSSGHTVLISDLGGAAIAAGTLAILFLALLNAFGEHLREQRVAIDRMQLASEQAMVEAARRQEELEHLKALDRLKQDFLNAASHELRTPLTSIMGYAEFLDDDLAGPLTGEQRDYVHQIQAGAVRLQSLVDDLLDFARLEAGTFQLALGRVDLCSVVSREVATLSPQARAKEVALSVELPEAPVFLSVDPQRIGQVLLNLVGNAIKFNRKGGRVTVSVQAEGECVCVAVTDTGIGIPPEHLARLFDKFYQVDPSTTREHGGAGLGLAISRAIVEAHGGSIVVQSALGAGSTFSFRLPRQVGTRSLAEATGRNGQTA